MSSSSWASSSAYSHLNCITVRACRVRGSVSTVSIMPSRKLATRSSGGREAACSSVQSARSSRGSETSSRIACRISRLPRKCQYTAPLVTFASLAICSNVVLAMPWRSKQASAASTIPWRVRAASSLVLRIPGILHTFRNVYNGPSRRTAAPLPMTSLSASARRLAFLVLPVAVAACHGKEDAAKAAAAAAASQPLPVTAVKVSQQRVPVSLEAVGQAEGSRDVEIRARVTGIIEKRAYEEGAPVQAGQLLFLIDPAPFELAVDGARAALQQERVKRDLAETDAKRLEPLAREKAIAQRDYDSAVATARTSTASIAAAEAKLKEAELNLSYTKVTEI